MPKLVLYDIATLGPSAISIINTNNALIEDALENTLSRNGSEPNMMGADLDMNSHFILNSNDLDMNGHRIRNLPAPIGATEPVRLGDIGDIFSQIQLTTDLGVSVPFLDYVTTQLNRLRLRNDQLSELIASVTAEQESNNWQDRRELLSVLSAQYGTASASIGQIQIVAASDRAAFASFQTVVNAHFDTVDASISTTSSTLATLTSSIASLSTSVDARFSGSTSTALSTSIATNTANISTNTTAIATATASIATLSTSVNARFSGSTSTGLSTSIATNTANIATNTTAIATNTSAISTLDTSVNARFSGSTSTGLSTSIATNTADIVTNTTAIATANTSIATLNTSVNARFSGSTTTTLSTNIATNTADIATNATAIASANTSISSLTTSVSARFAGSTATQLSTDIAANSASITTNATAIASLGTTVSAKYGVALDVNGYITGFESTNTGTSSSFTVVADTFKIVAPRATVTLTIASPGVVNKTAHGLIAATPVIFETTGALPTGITAGTVYYVATAGLNTNDFGIVTASDGSGTRINFTGSQSGTPSYRTGGVSTALFEVANRNGVAAVVIKGTIMADNIVTTNTTVVNAISSTSVSTPADTTLNDAGAHTLVAATITKTINATDSGVLIQGGLELEKLAFAGASPGANYVCYVSLYVDSSLKKEVLLLPWWNGLSWSIWASRDMFYYVTGLSAASHTFELKVRGLGNTTNQLNVNNIRFIVQELKR